MNIKTICSFGIKVIAAGVAGIAVFLGIGRLSKTKKCRTGDPSELETDSLNVSEQQLPQEAEPASNDNIMNGLKKVQDISNKVFAVVQSLTIVADNLSRVFSNKGGAANYNQAYFGRDPWSYCQPVDMGNGQVWNRISPYIIEVPPTNYQRNSYSI